MFLKKKKKCFLGDINLIFSILAVCILLGFCFRLNNFASKISNLLLPLWAEGCGGCES